MFSLPRLQVAVEAEQDEEQHVQMMLATPELAEVAGMTERALALRIQAKRCASRHSATTPPLPCCDDDSAPERRPPRPLASCARIPPDAAPSAAAPFVDR